MHGLTCQLHLQVPALADVLVQDGVGESGLGQRVLHAQMLLHLDVLRGTNVHLLVGQLQVLKGHQAFTSTATSIGIVCVVAVVAVVIVFAAAAVTDSCGVVENPSGHCVFLGRPPGLFFADPFAGNFCHGEVDEEEGGGWEGGCNLAVVQDS